MLKGLIDHPLRRILSEEMHARKLPQIQAPARLMQLILQRQDEGDSELNKLAKLCHEDIDTLRRKRFFSRQLEAMHLNWERHTETSSYTFILPSSGEFPFDPLPFSNLIGEWFCDIDAVVVRATLCEFVTTDWKHDAGKLFDASDVISCNVAGGAARIWSDFRLHADGYGHLLIMDKGLQGPEGALVFRRMQDLGNYRNMALLGLPVAQQLTPKVSELEVHLASLTAAIADRKKSDMHLLEDVSSLSAELANLAAQTRFRMSASRAYAKICEERLVSLNTVAIPGYQDLTDFTDSRLLPAVRTCDSFAARLDDLSQRTAWATSLLRTRVDTEVSQQNRDLLESMNHRTAVQLRLQSMVESLSSVAISYYLVGLLAYVLHGVDHIGLVSPNIALAFIAPVVLSGVWLTLHKMRSRYRIAAHGNADLRRNGRADRDVVNTRE
jgi:uncharacterized membrane-anchored protein